jgi:lysozyme
MGIDISHNNGKVDFAAVKAAGHSFVWIKATEGNGFVDPMFFHNWNAASEAGLIRGAYHFMRSGQGGKSQAEHFHDTLHLAGGLKDTDMGVCLDYEDRTGIAAMGTAAAVAEAREFLAEIQWLSGRHPVIYLDRSMGEQEVNGAFGDYHLWLAQYTQASAPSVPAQWSDWAFWQYDQYGTVSGVPGERSVDLDHFRLGPDGLDAWCAMTIIR